MVDALIYAPIGLVYERQAVWDSLVRRGKSQVNLARFMAQSAANQGTANWEQVVSEAVDEVASTVVDVLTEVGSFLGLVPDSQPSGSSPHSESSKKPAQSDTPQAVNPISQYDLKTVKEILPLLGDLTAEQLAVVRSEEKLGKARKSILDRVDRLLA